jgi:hypothetical protein
MPLVGFLYFLYEDPTIPLHVGTVIYLYKGSQVRVHSPLVGFLYVFYEDPISPLHVGTVIYLYEGSQIRVHRQRVTNRRRLS